MTVKAVRDLRPLFGDARNQGSRPTCTAFACSDIHAACRPPWLPLSSEYAFYHGVRRQGTDPNGGVHLHHMLDVIEADGQPQELAWPYQLTPPAGVWAPPADVGELFFAKGAQTSPGILSMRSALDQAIPVLLVMTLSDAFYAPNANAVVDSDEVVDVTRVHALVAVGHGTCAQHAFTLVRNSWGTGWGLAGHAWLSDRYLAPRLLNLATVQKVP